MHETILPPEASAQSAIDALEGSICRVEVDGRRTGTAFVVGADFALTCRHCVEGAERGNGVKITLVFGPLDQPDCREAVLVRPPSPEQDCALLRVVDAPVDRTVPLGRSATRDARWRSVFYPPKEDEPAITIGQNADIVSTARRVFGVSTLELRGGETFGRVGGFSGAPVLSEGRIVGIVSEQLTRAHHDAAADRLYAVRLADIAWQELEPFFEDGSDRNALHPISVFALTIVLASSSAAVFLGHSLVLGYVAAGLAVFSTALILAPPNHRLDELERRTHGLTVRAVLELALGTLRRVYAPKGTQTRSWKRVLAISAFGVFVALACITWQVGWHAWKSDLWMGWLIGVTPITICLLVLNVVADTISFHVTRCLLEREIRSTRRVTMALAFVVDSLLCVGTALGPPLVATMITIAAFDFVMLQTADFGWLGQTEAPFGVELQNAMAQGVALSSITGSSRLPVEAQNAVRMTFVWTGLTAGLPSLAVWLGLIAGLVGIPGGGRFYRWCGQLVNQASGQLRLVIALAHALLLLLAVAATRPSDKTPEQLLADARVALGEVSGARNHRRAVLLYPQACDRGSEEACAEWAEILVSGDVLLPRPRNAIEACARSKMCDEDALDVDRPYDFTWKLVRDFCLDFGVQASCISLSQRGNPYPLSRTEWGELCREGTVTEMSCPLWWNWAFSVGARTPDGADDTGARAAWLLDTTSHVTARRVNVLRGLDGWSDLDEESRRLLTEFAVEDRTQECLEYDCYYFIEEWKKVESEYSGLYERAWRQIRQAVRRDPALRRVLVRADLPDDVRGLVDRSVSRACKTGSVQDCDTLASHRKPSQWLSELEHGCSLGSWKSCVTVHRLEPTATSATALEEAMEEASPESLDEAWSMLRRRHAHLAEPLVGPAAEACALLDPQACKLTNRIRSGMRNHKGMLAKLEESALVHTCRAKRSEVTCVLVAKVLVSQGRNPDFDLDENHIVSNWPSDFPSGVWEVLSGVRDSNDYSTSLHRWAMRQAVSGCLADEPEACMTMLAIGLGKSRLIEEVWDDVGAKALQHQPAHAFGCLGPRDLEKIREKKAAGLPDPMKGATHSLLVTAGMVRELDDGDASVAVTTAARLAAGVAVDTTEWTTWLEAALMLPRARRPLAECLRQCEQTKACEVGCTWLDEHEPVCLPRFTLVSSRPRWRFLDVQELPLPEIDWSSDGRGTLTSSSELLGLDVGDELKIVGGENGIRPHGMRAFKGAGRFSREELQLWWLATRWQGDHGQQKLSQPASRN